MLMKTGSRLAAMVLDDSVLSMGLKNTHKKTELGLCNCGMIDPDFMLLTVSGGGYHVA